MFDDTNPAAGRLGAISPDERAPGGFSLKERRSPAPGRLGLVAAEAEARDKELPDRPTQTPSAPSARRVVAPAAPGPPEPRPDPELLRIIDEALPESKKSTFKIPIDTYLELKAFATCTRSTQYELVGEALETFLDEACARLTPPAREQIEDRIRRLKLQLGIKTARKTGRTVRPELIPDAPQRRRGDAETVRGRIGEVRPAEEPRQG
jgi:hypothetical protein